PIFPCHDNALEVRNDRSGMWHDENRPSGVIDQGPDVGIGVAILFILTSDDEVWRAHAGERRERAVSGKRLQAAPLMGQSGVSHTAFDVRAQPFSTILVELRRNLQELGIGKDGGGCVRHRQCFRMHADQMAVPTLRQRYGAVEHARICPLVLKNGDYGLERRGEPSLAAIIARPFARTYSLKTSVPFRLSGSAPRPWPRPRRELPRVPAGYGRARPAPSRICLRHISGKSR